VTFFWTLGCARSPKPLVELVAPNTDVDLIYRVDGPRQPLIRGPQRRLTSISIDCSTTYVGVRLGVGTAQRLTGLAVGELLDCRLRAAACENDEFMDHLHGTDFVLDVQRAFAAFASILRERAARSGPAVKLGIASKATRMIRGANGASPIRDIARHLGCSERHLRRTVVAATGLSPKEHARIVRFQRAMHLVTRTSRSLAEIALDLAYTDQAHMTREFGELSGWTPLSLRHAMSAFDKKSTAIPG
jgi:AraC-like DNA-binding protein